MKMTSHAQQRGQQRSITESHIQLLLAFGRLEYRNGNVHACYLDKKARKTLEKIFRQGPQLLDKLASHEVILDDNEEIITCYHRTKRNRR